MDKIVILLEGAFMVGYPYTYGDDLTPEQASKNRKVFLIGVIAGISLYFALTQAANAADGKIPPSPAGTKNKLFSALITAFCGTGVTSGGYWVGLV